MISGEDIRRLRKGKSWTQQELADRVGVAKTTVLDWEKDRYFPEGKNLANLARALSVSMAYILGESPDLPPDTRILTPENTFPIPLLSPVAIACAGSGNGGMDGIILEAEEFIVLPKDLIGPISVDRDKQPFAIIVEGDSMMEAGIPDHCQAVINPIAEIGNGDAVLACFGRRNEWAIKWIYFHPDGRIELRSSSTRYPAMVFLPEEREEQNLRVIGKVVRTTAQPKRGV